MEKIKQFFEQTINSEKGKDILTVIIVILVGLGCFELGRLSGTNGTSGVKIEYPNQDLQPVATDKGANVLYAAQSVNPVAGQLVKNSDSSGKNFFASSRGSKYYTLGCSAGKTIKLENRIYFSTGEEAQQAGYKLSSSCN